MPRVELTIENHELLKKASSKRNISMFDIVNNLIEDIGVADKEEKVILSIPPTLIRKDKDGLRRWLQLRMQAVLNVYYPGETNVNPTSN